MSVSRSIREELPNGQFRFTTLYGWPRPMSRDMVAMVVTNRLIRRAYDAAKRVCVPGREGDFMPSMPELREAAERLLAA